MPWFMCTPWVPKFSGEDGNIGFGEWRTQMQAMLRAQGLTDEQRVDFVLGALEGRARREARLVPEAQRHTVEQLWATLEGLFARPVPLSVVRTRFFQCKQEQGETLDGYLLRLRELHGHWRGREPAGGDDRGMLLRDQFLLGLSAGPVRQELQRQVRRHAELTFLQVCGEARELGEEAQAIEGSTCHAVQPAPIPGPDRARAAELEVWKQEVRAELRQELHEQLATLGKTLAMELRQQWPQAPVPPSLDQGAGPMMARAEHQGPRTATGRAGEFHWDAQGRPICAECGQAGHVRRWCPRRQGPLNGQPQPR